MSNELALTWYVVFDYVLYDFKTNFRIISEHPDSGVVTNNATYHQFSSKEEAVAYINSTIEHQVKTINLVIKSIPQQPYEG